MIDQHLVVLQEFEGAVERDAQPPAAIDERIGAEIGFGPAPIREIHLDRDQPLRRRDLQKRVGDKPCRAPPEKRAGLDRHIEPITSNQLDQMLAQHGITGHVHAGVAFDTVESHSASPPCLCRGA